MRYWAAGLPSCSWHLARRPQSYPWKKGRRSLPRALPLVAGPWRRQEEPCPVALPGALKTSG